MGTITKLIPYEIVLFAGDEAQAPFVANPLKDFLYYLKFFGKKGMINFSFAAAEESFHPNLSVKDNYILDSSHISVIQEKEKHFFSTAESLLNQHLKQLVSCTECLERLAKDLSKEEKKLVGIVKAILSQSDYIFLERPELFMPSQWLKVVKDALTHEARENGRTVFIQAENQEAWLDVATHIARRNERGEYVKLANRLSQPVQKKAA